MTDTNNLSSGPIVVGVDESPHTRPALEWALREAETTGHDVELVHGLGLTPRPIPLRMYGSLPDPDEPRLRAHGSALVAELVDAAAEIAPKVAVTSHLVDSEAAPALIDAAAHARLVVLGSRPIGTFGAIALGSVGNAVAGHADRPVVVVRGPAGAASEGAGVVVGIDGASTEALGFAFEYASVHQVPVHAVLCWRPDVLAEMKWRGTPPAPAEADVLLAEALAGWQERFPDVRVRSGVERAHPVDGLVSASHGQQLLVVGRHRHVERFGPLIGSVGLGVLHHATCPVAVVPTS